MKSSTSKIIVIAALLLVVAVAYGVWLAARPKAIVLQGQMDARHTDIAAKVPGRVGKVLVKEGDRVAVNTPLLEMDAPEIDAKVAEARAGQEAAEAVARKADNGARAQEVQMAYQTYLRAQAAADLSATTYKRVKTLADEGLLARQKRDEAYTKYITDAEQAKAARAQYNMARQGARSEDKDAAHAQARMVAAKVDQAKVAEDEAHLKSPVTGVVDSVLIHAGEIVPQGVPVVTVVDLQDQWLVLNVREDVLGHFGIGQTFEGTLPALGEAGKNLRFTVFASKALPDFATWRATRNNDGFDMRTFEIRARPTQPLAQLRPGMSVLVNIPR